MGNGLSNKIVKIIILGLDNSGKSTLYHRIKLNKLILSKPTNGSICETFKSNMKESTIKNSTIQLLDVNGRQNSRTMWVTYLHSADAIIYVIDISDNSRIEEAKLELQGLIMSNESKEIPILILLNKIDKENCRDPKVITKYLDLVSLDPKRWWLVKSVCLVTGEGLVGSINSLHELIINVRKHGKVPPHKTDEYVLNTLNKHNYTFSE